MPKALPASLLVRELSQKDIPSLAELLTAAPDDGTLYGFPNVQQHPQNMLRLHIGWLRQALCDETSLIRIAIIPNEGGNGAKVVGFSSWVRTVVDLNGAGKIRPKHWRQATWMDAFNNYLMALESKYKRFYSKLHPDPALVPDPQRQAAVMRMRIRTPSPNKSTPCYRLDGLAIHPDFQGCGVGTLLMRWGLDRAAEEKVPVFAIGEERGVSFYEKALGFRRLAKTEYWLDRDAKEVSREEVEMGNAAWKTANGGVSGCEVCWCPEGVVLDVDGCVKKDKTPKLPE